MMLGHWRWIRTIKMPRRNRCRCCSSLCFSSFDLKVIFVILQTVLLFVTTIGFTSAAVDTTTRFDFGSLTLNNLKLLGDAHVKNGSIQLSRDLPVPNSGAGRALYASPVRLRHPTTLQAFSFSTFFSFSVVNVNPSSIGGGLAFILASDDHSIGDPGGFLGLINGSNVVDEEGAIVVAVEFDTLMDVEFSDVNGNHVGVDLNSLVSSQVADLDAVDIYLKSGDLINVWIEYDGLDQVLQVFVSYSTVRPGDPLISFLVDLGKYINDDMFVGFSGSTQGSTEIHSVAWWNFSSSGSTVPINGGSAGAGNASPPSVTSNSTSEHSSGTFLGPSISTTAAQSPDVGSSASSQTSPSSCRNNGLCKQGPGAVAGVATAGVFFLAFFAGLGAWVFSRKSKKSVDKTENLMVIDIVRSPREFTYRELATATRGFDQFRIIGRGAVGTVYKGIIPNTGAIVAVKRCINDDRTGGHGKAEFLSELSIIASLRHRNLVRLQGWCQEKGEILLVYDYMPNGSLDKALYDTSASTDVLSWCHRKKILTGVASALAYLHRECERQVIHRDVKSSNIMLDVEFQARLGDFGLARQVEHDKSPEATVTAGTMGYLAPEYLLTGRATDKTDVFSFGAVVLEVVCGRRPIESKTSIAVPASSRTTATANLVEWVWGLHGQGRLMEAVDRRMAGEFDEADIRRVMLVGLACSQPDPVMRPGMRAVVQILTGESDPPVVPVAKPSMSFSSTQQLLMSLQDSASEYNGFLINLSSSSSSSGSVNGGNISRR